MELTKPSSLDSSVLARVRELVGLHPAPRCSAPAPLAEDEPLTVLAKWARDEGLPLTLFQAPPSAAILGTEVDRPVVTFDPEGTPLFLTGRVGPMVRVESTDGHREWLAAPALARRLGLAHEGVEHSWLAPEGAGGSSAPPSAHASPWRDTFALLRPEGRDLATIAIYAIAIGVLSLTLPLAVQSLVNAVAFGSVLQPVVVLTFLLAGGLTFAAVLRALQAWVVEVVQRRLFVRLVSALGERLPRVHVRAFDRAHGPELLNRFFDVFLAQKSLASLLLDGVEAALTTLVGILVLAFYHPWLLAFGVLILASAAFVLVGLARGATATTVAESKAKYAVAGWLEEMARHLFALKLPGGEELARVRLDRLASDWIATRSDHYRVVFRQLLGALALQVVVSATLLGLGGWLVIERELTLGQLVAAELIVSAVVASLSKLGSKLETVYDLVASADKLGALLSLPLERDEGELPPAEDGGASLELRGAEIGGTPAGGFQLHLAAGDRIALDVDEARGRTLVEMVFGLREPERGSILLDGHDLRDLHLSWIRRRVAIVRTPEILGGTVADNVRPGRPDLTATAAWEALRRVGLETQVRELPRGLHTELAPDGAPLGHESALRLTLARALAARPGLLVLDGVLDALPPSERPDLVEHLAEGRTLLAITRDSSVGPSCGLRRASTELLS